MNEILDRKVARDLAKNTYNEPSVWAVKDRKRKVAEELANGTRLLSDLTEGQILDLINSEIVSMTERHFRSMLGHETNHYRYGSHASSRYRLPDGRHISIKVEIEEAPGRAAE